MSGRPTTKASGGGEGNRIELFTASRSGLRRQRADCWLAEKRSYERLIIVAASAAAGRVLIHQAPARRRAIFGWRFVTLELAGTARQVRDLAGGQVLQTDAGGLNVPLEPYQLRSFLVRGERPALTHVHGEAP